MQSLIVTIFVGLVAAANAQNSLQSNNNQQQNCGVLVSGTVVPDMNDCAQYFVCLNGILQQFTCPKSFSFSQIKQMCVYNLKCWHEEKDVTLAPVTIPTPTVSNPCAGRPTGTYLPSSLSCKQFYYCYEGQSVLRNCPIGYSYSSLKSVCVLSTTQCV